jgi:RHS repeat-associated protein
LTLFAPDLLDQMTNMVDAEGTTQYRYTYLVLLSEDGPWSSNTVSYVHTNRTRKTLTLEQPGAASWVSQYGHDAMRRLTAVTNAAGTFGYAYKVGQASSLPLRLDLPGGSYVTNVYDANAPLLSTKLLNSQHSTLNSPSYQLNTGNQRTAVTNWAASHWEYVYDGTGQLVSASGKEPGGTPDRLHEQFGYGYDAAGNLAIRTNNALVQTFGVDNLNQLSNATRTGTLTVAGATTLAATSVTVNGSNAIRYADLSFASTNHPVANGTNVFTAVAQNAAGKADTNTVTAWLPATANFVYDSNGNLISDGRRTLDWDDENQLIRVTVTNQFKSEFSYDGKMRRRIVKEYGWSGGAWVLTNETRYVFDGMLVVQERNSGNQPVLTYTRGRDLSATLEGAGGIGGLLAMTEPSTINSPTIHSYYHCDGNGNVTALVNTNQLIVARYAYDPYGNTLATSGPKAALNPYRFSSKENHERSGFYCYGYRFYVPELQRWLNRDRIGEENEYNLYQFASNDSISNADAFGLMSILPKNIPKPPNWPGNPLPPTLPNPPDSCLKEVIKRIANACALGQPPAEEDCFDFCFALWGSNSYMVLKCQEVDCPSCWGKLK